jgi:hypothetical protein
MKKISLDLDDDNLLPWELSNDEEGMPFSTTNTLK